MKRLFPAILVVITATLSVFSVANAQTPLPVPKTIHPIIPTSGLVAQYDLTGLAGGTTSVANIVSGGPALTLVGSPTLGATGVTFAGGTQYAKSASAFPGITLGGQWTAIVVLNDSSTGGSQGLISMGYTTSANYYDSVVHNGTGSGAQAGWTDYWVASRNGGTQSIGAGNPYNAPSGTFSLLEAWSDGTNFNATRLDWGGPGRSAAIPSGAGSTYPLYLGVGLQLENTNVYITQSLTVSYVLVWNRLLTQHEVLGVTNWLYSYMAQSPRSTVLSAYKRPPLVATTFPSNNATVSPTPPMGWSSWEAYGTSVTDAKVVANAAAMVSNGMQAAGYRYVNVDEGWKQSSRDSNGNLQASTSFLTTYPTMSALASYVHNLGYKFGLYVTEGTTACVGSSAPSAGYEYQDANLLSSWGIDFLKIDECNGMAYDSDPNVWASASSNYLYQAVWGLWSAALRSTGRQIFNYIASGPVGTVSAQWASQAGGNMWRIGPDIGYQWSTVDPYFDLLATAGLAGQAGPTKGWNDPDALIVGNVNLTDTQGQTQMSLWAINAAPLISSVDLTTLSANSLATLTNSEVIAVDQDPFGAQGVRISKTACGSGSSTGNNYCEVWAKQLTGTNTCAIGLFNRSGTAQSITATFATIAASIPACGSGPYTTTRDLWAHASLGTLTTSYTASSIPAYGSVMIKVAP